MTADAVVLHDSRITFFDADVGGVVLKGERQTVVEAVQCFGEPLVHDVVGHVAVVTNGDGFMAALSPCRIFFFHDMTVGAGCGIVRKIGCPFGIGERENAQAH